MKKFIYGLIIIFSIVSCGEIGFSENDVSFSEGGTSQGGSLARFSIVGDYLYIVNDQSLVPINITNLENPIVGEEIELGFGIETIFPYRGNLFVGSASAVYIYDISNPAMPLFRSIYQHATGCDPVVVSGNFAYVTLREGISCGNFSNSNILEVVDVSDLSNPRQMNSIPMSNPRGLGLGCNNKLFVCDGPAGIVQFDITDPGQPLYERTYGQYHANDVIVKDDLVIVTGNDGVYQYSCASDSLEILSILPFSL